MADLWTLNLFDTYFDRWVQQDQPPDWLQATVLAWIPTRRLDPTRGARAEPGFADLWRIQIPGSSDGHRAVLCSYWIFKADRLVRCDNYGWLSLPII